jgi:hypothetical protein
MIIDFLKKLFAAIWESITKKQAPVLKVPEAGEQLELTTQGGAMDKTLATFLWNARWAIRANKPDSAWEEVTKALEYIGAEKPETPVTPPTPEAEPDRPSKNEKGAGLLWIPGAEIITPKMPTSGVYAAKYPMGAIVHFTAGRSLKGDSDAKGSVAWGREEGLTFLTISSDGTIFQAHPINEKGSHAGISKWPGLGEQVSSKLIGIEIANAGRLEKIDDNKFKSWFGEIYTKDQVRYVEESDYGCPSGYYHKYTPQQEESLTWVLLWMKRNDPYGVFSFDYVLGHHEVAGMKGIGYWRKNDPGGALSMTMPAFRKMLIEKEKAV